MRPGFYTLVFYIIINNSKFNRNKKSPSTLFQSLLSRKRMQNFNQKYYILWQLELVKIFNFSDKKTWFLEIIDIYFNLGKGFCTAWLVLPNYEEMSP